MESIMIIAFIVIFILAFIFIIINIFTAPRLPKIDRNAPIDTIKAKVIAKRTDVSGSHFHDDNLNMINTHYYVTFELYNKERKEFIVDSNNYGLLIEGDEGMLTYQGIIFKSFDRQK